MFVFVIDNGLEKYKVKREKDWFIHQNSFSVCDIKILIVTLYSYIFATPNCCPS